MEKLLDLQSLTLLEQAVAQMPGLVDSEVDAWMSATVRHLAGEVQERTPAAEGLLRNSIHDDKTRLADGFLGVVGSSLNYVESVELGTKPHMPPAQPLVQWVATKLGLSGPVGEAVARRIQWNISHHGTPAVGMFHRAWAANKNQVENGFRVAMARAAARFAGGER